MVEFDMQDMRSRIPGKRHNRMSLHAASRSRRRRFYMVDGQRRLRDVDSPYIVTADAARTQAGWIGRLRVDIFGIEIVYPAVRNLSPDVVLVSPKTPPTTFTKEKPALELARSLLPKLNAQLYHEVSKL